MEFSIDMLFRIIKNIKEYNKVIVSDLDKCN